MPGLGLVLALAVASTVVGKEFPLVGGPVTGIVLGVLLAALKKPGARLRPGIGFASKRILQASVVLLGSQLSLAQIVHVGVGSIPVSAAHHGLSELSVFLITVALSATGLSTDLAALRRTGPRPLILGACLWVVVSVTSLVLNS
ncbi:putative sulfate exporter family transporter [Streptomyces sp. NPDC059474]|uniref:putative sulfate exporter family transporter n=1 Tax=Streptomyces sp. NPDC059474 TaxID=3346846 RepID=UPI0036B2197F